MSVSVGVQRRPALRAQDPEAPSEEPFASVSTGRAAGTGLHSEDTKPAGALGGAPYPEVLFANWGLWHPPPPHPFLRVRGRRSGEDATCLGSRESQWEPDGMSGSDQWDSRCFPKSHELHSLAFPPPLPGALSAGRSTPALGPRSLGSPAPPTSGCVRYTHKCPGVKT